MAIKDFVFLTESAGDEFEIDLTKNQYFMESASMLKRVQLSEAKLKVARENGTDEDLTYLESVINDDYIDKMEKTVEKSIADFSKYVDKVNDSFNKQIASAEMTKVAEDAKEAMKTNRVIKSQEINAIDATDEIKCINKYIDENMRIIHKLSNGMATKADVDKVEKLMDSYNADIQSIRKNGLTVDEKFSKVFKDMFKNFGNVPKLLKEVEEENASFSHDVLIPLVKAKKHAKDTEIGSVSTKTLSNDVMLHKDLVDAYVKQITSQYAAIKTAVEALKKEKNDTKDSTDSVKKESVEENFDDGLSIVEELTGFYNESVDDYMKDNPELLEESDDGDIKDIEKEIDDTMKDADKELDDVKTESADRGPAIKSSVADIKKSITNDGINNVAKSDEGKVLIGQLLKYVTGSSSPIVVSKNGVANSTKDEVASFINDFKTDHEIKKMKDERAIYSYVIGLCNDFAKSVHKDAIDAYTDAVDKCVSKGDASALDVMATDLSKGGSGIVKSNVDMDDSVAKELLAIVKKGQKKVGKTSDTDEKVTEESTGFDLDAYMDSLEDLLN